MRRERGEGDERVEKRGRRGPMPNLLCLTVRITAVVDEPR